MAHIESWFSEELQRTVNSFESQADRLKFISQCYTPDMFILTWKTGQHYFCCLSWQDERVPDGAFQDTVQNFLTISAILNHPLTGGVSA